MGVSLAVRGHFKVSIRCQSEFRCGAADGSAQCCIKGSCFRFRFCLLICLYDCQFVSGYLEKSQPESVKLGTLHGHLPKSHQLLSQISTRNLAHPSQNFNREVER